MRVTHDDGTVLELGLNEAYVIEPGHGAEILGDERFVGFEFGAGPLRSTRVSRSGLCRASLVSGPHA
jgi:hypothetical protein